ncbi:putative peroxisomal biogenesis factor 3 isoform X2 [Apostichopus japonicus]|uniref:Peroxisomal biogenesis factor 3 n=1 Tax=Stichopus japonicus TaxID=307972 RepID=A0A2G8JX97_STIJA|nr:putative peroxisomal biogenesis factor 3 isoform X2 [Apostichopus japonicus]
MCGEMVTLLTYSKDIICKKAKLQSFRPFHAVYLKRMNVDRCFTRTLVTVYSTTMLAAFLRVQLNVLGGYMYIDSCIDDNNQKSFSLQAAPDVQQEYLSQVQYLLLDGITDLTKTVTEAVENVLGKLSLQDSMKLQDMEDCLTKLRGQVEVLSSDNDVLLAGNMVHPLSRYMMGAEGGNQSSCKLASSQESIHRIMQETRDVIESNDFCLVLNNCLDIAFSRLLDNMAHFFRPSVQGELSNRDFNPYKTQLPLAKVIPMMNAQIFTLCSDAPNQFVQELLLVPFMKDFAANIYESFSQVKIHRADP